MQKACISFALLKPGMYEIDVAVKGLAKSEFCTVGVGRTTTLDLTLEVTISIETVPVSSGAPLINTDRGIVTSYTPTEVALLPAAGGDMTTIAFTAPGAVVSPGRGIGNFTVNGLPATSNLFTVNNSRLLNTAVGAASGIPLAVCTNC